MPVYVLSNDKVFTGGYLMFANFADFFFYVPQVRVNFFIITVSICYIRCKSSKHLTLNIPITEPTYSLDNPYFSQAILQTYLGHRQTSRMELFSKLVNGVKDVKYFRKKAPSQMFGRVLNTPLYTKWTESKLLWSASKN